MGGRCGGLDTHNSEITTEADLLCRSVALFTTNNSLTVCPFHRYTLGLDYRQGKTYASRIFKFSYYFVVFIFFFAECELGFSSRKSYSCEPCVFNFFGEGCAYKCMCNVLQR